MKHEPIYTHDWISPYFPLWESLLPCTPHQQVLEIGCFEGRATCWFLEHLPDCTVTCIDTFEGGADHKELGMDFSGVIARWQHNTNPWGERSQYMIGLSIDSLDTLKGQGRRFDLALIDGSHLACDVLSDAILTWPLMHPGGIVIFDDYGWGGARLPEQTPKPAIDSFLACYKGQYEALEQGYQVIVRKL